MNKWTYFFSQELTDGRKEMKNLLGGKGANLAEMCSIGINVPAGFTITTEACLSYQSKNELSPEIKNQVEQSLNKLEEITGKKLGDEKNPLLVSVRSGAAVSMPGMMDTVLNLGINDQVVESIAESTNNPRFAWDSYRRFIEMYSDVVLGVNSSILSVSFEDFKAEKGANEDTDLTTEDLKQVVKLFKQTLLQESGVCFPTDPQTQLWLAIEAVFKSWSNPRAIKYRELNNISDDIGTAVNVQSMVFGNFGDDSATGVCFTRDPSTGDKKFFGEYLINAQGEDVVAGTRTPCPINNESKNDTNKMHATLQEVLPEAYEDLVKVYQKLETHYLDMQDIEFTIEKGELFLLQTRNGKRTASAAIKIAVDLVEENLISEKEAILRIDPNAINQLLHPRINPGVNEIFLAQGLPASPGAASGILAFSAEEAVEMGDKGVACILVRQETSPEDIAGMVSSAGILTSRGGMTSHAAVVARGMGKPCVAGCSAATIHEDSKTITIGGQNLKSGDKLTIEGSSGKIYLGEVPTQEAQLTPEFYLLMEMADKYRTMNVRTNADTPKDVVKALSFGAEGIGLCRTEHMFFDAERILAVREMIFANSKEERELALAKILPFQKEDFIGIFKALKGLPCNIRLLDPPLHEFLPTLEKDQLGLAEKVGVELAEIKNRMENLEEFNPMLGHRGCRLGITYPEIYQFQTRAILEAAIDCYRSGVDVNPEIMVPLTASIEEFREVKKIICAEINLLKETNPEIDKIDYKIGTMIEIPRAAILAKGIAKDADFFSFGTNDLTQTTYGISRDDGGKFLPSYIERQVFPEDPFSHLDRDGVGFLVKLATEEGRAGNSQLHVGICGEHGGDPKSIDFCQEINLEYISCSPFRVPIARVAAAQAVLKGE
jgi:pyruvate, orthophosphate dikinase